MLPVGIHECTLYCKIMLVRRGYSGDESYWELLPSGLYNHQTMEYSPSCYTNLVIQPLHQPVSHFTTIQSLHQPFSNSKPPNHYTNHFPTSQPSNHYTNHFPIQNHPTFTLTIFPLHNHPTITPTIFQFKTIQPLH